ncbi:MAG: rhodanese-like domain-containing protein [Kiloniellaceae bacterium]
MAGEYAGDVSSRAAWDILARDPHAVLVDVRTEPEWRYVGLPDLADLGKRTVCVSWQVYPDMRHNPRFAEELEREGVSAERTVLLLCRSGQRSRDAAITLTARGYRRCYNVADGFEGPPDERRHRGARDGWKAVGLPWRQE